LQGHAGIAAGGHEIKAELPKLSCPALVFIETCGSGGFATAHPDDPPVPANVVAFCACSASQTASNELDIAVAEALYGRADFNHDGVVDADELVRYVRARYREWWPDAKASDGTGTPVIVTSNRVPGSLSLTKVSPALSAIDWQNNLWSALLEKQAGNTCQIHLLGWSSKPGDGYFLTNSAPRDLLCLPSDGPPLLVNNGGQWFPARLVHRDGTKYTVHRLGQNGDEVVTPDRIKYPFAGQER
jgi:hypothetical protein